MAVGVGVAGVVGGGGLLGEAGVAGSGFAQDVLDVGGAFGEFVELEGEGGGEADAGLAAHFTSENASGGGEGLGGELALVGVAEDGVEDGRVLEVTADAHLGDRDEAEAVVFDAAGVDHLGDDLADAVGEAAGALPGGGRIRHQSLAFSRSS